MRRRRVVVAAVLLVAGAAGAWYGFGRGPKPTLVQTATVVREDLSRSPAASSACCSAPWWRPACESC